MRPVYVVSGGVSKFIPTHPGRTFQAGFKKTSSFTNQVIRLDSATLAGLFDLSATYNSYAHIPRLPMAGIRVQCCPGSAPEANPKVKGEGATGALCSPKRENPSCPVKGSSASISALCR